MKKYSGQIERIKGKLVQGGYKVNQPSLPKEVEEFEANYSIQLPECYRSFLIQVGNGVDGILPLEEGNDALVSNPKQYFQKEPFINPNQSGEAWDKLRRQESIDNCFQGILPLSNEDDYYNQVVYGILLHGPYKGRVMVYAYSEGEPENLLFFIDKNFLDWFERWLDEDSGFGVFGREIEKSANKLIEVFQHSDEILMKQEALKHLLAKKEISEESIGILESEYIHRNEHYNQLLLYILTKFDYLRAKPYLTSLLHESTENLHSVASTICGYAKDHIFEWTELIQQQTLHIKDWWTLHSCTELLQKSRVDIGNWMIPFTSHEDGRVKEYAFQTLGKLEDKAKYVKTFISGLRDDSEYVVLATLKALAGTKDRILLREYQQLVKRFPIGIGKYHIYKRIRDRLEEYGIHISIIQTIDPDTFSIDLADEGKGEA